MRPLASKEGTGGSRSSQDNRDLRCTGGRATYSSGGELLCGGRGGGEAGNRAPSSPSHCGGASSSEPFDSPKNVAGGACLMSRRVGVRISCKRFGFFTKNGRTGLLLALMVSTICTSFALPFSTRSPMRYSLMSGTLPSVAISSSHAMPTTGMFHSFALSYFAPQALGQSRCVERRENICASVMPNARSRRFVQHSSD